MERCIFCSKNVTRLSRHLLEVHQIQATYLKPNTVREFVLMCREFPFNPEEWCILDKKAKAMNDYLYNGKPLPPELFQMIYSAFESYQFTYPKLVLLENSLEQKSSEEKGVAAPPKRKKKKVIEAPSDPSASSLINNQNSQPL